MAENKTRADATDPETIIATIENPARRADARALMEMMEVITGEPPVVWGGRMIGFGRYRYVYDSGHKGEFFLTGFAARKSDFSIHIMIGFGDFEAELVKLGPHKHGVSCLYIRSLDAIDVPTLRKMISQSVERMRARYPASAG